MWPDPNTVYGANFYKGVGFVVGIVCWVVWGVKECISRIRTYGGSFNQVISIVVEFSMDFTAFFVSSFCYSFGYDVESVKDNKKEVPVIDFGNEPVVFARKEFHQYGYKAHIYTPTRQQFPRIGRLDMLYTDMTARIDYGWTGTAYCEVILKE